MNKAVEGCRLTPRGMRVRARSIVGRGCKFGAFVPVKRLQRTSALDTAHSQVGGAEYTGRKKEGNMTKAEEPAGKVWSFELLPRIVEMATAAAYIGISKRHFNKYLTSGQYPSFILGNDGKRFMRREIVEAIRRSRE